MPSVKVCKEELDFLHRTWKEAGKLSREAAQLSAQAIIQLRSICPHEETVTTSSYQPGDYYNRDRTYEHTRCKLCGVEISQRCTSVGSYG